MVAAKPSPQQLIDLSGGFVGGLNQQTHVKMCVSICAVQQGVTQHRAAGVGVTSCATVRLGGQVFLCFEHGQRPYDGFARLVRVAGGGKPRQTAGVA